jgi:hypothetical protein
MTLLGSRKDRSRLRPADVKELGTAGGARFVTFDKGEYMLDLQPLDAGAVPRPAGEGEIRVTRDASRTDYGTVTHYAETFRGVRVKDGTYASLAAKDQARADRKATRGQPALARYASNTPGLSGRAGHVMSGGAMRSLPALPAGSGAVGETEVVRAGVKLGSAGSYIPGRGPATVRERYDAFVAKGWTFDEPVPGKLQVDPPGGRMTTDQWDDFSKRQRLYLGIRRGQPVGCENHPGKGPAPEAVDIACVDIAYCGECLGR